MSPRSAQIKPWPLPERPNPWLTVETSGIAKSLKVLGKLGPCGLGKFPPRFGIQLANSSHGKKKKGGLGWNRSGDFGWLLLSPA